MGWKYCPSGDERDLGCARHFYPGLLSEVWDQRMAETVERETLLSFFLFCHTHSLWIYVFLLQRTPRYGWSLYGLYPNAGNVAPVCQHAEQPGYPRGPIRVDCGDQNDRHGRS